MPRFVDRKAIADLNLGPCECPNTPHANGDWVHVHEQQSYTDWLAIVDAGARGMEEYNRVRLQRRIKSWNLVDDKGKAIPITAATLGELDQSTANKIHEFLNDLDNPEAVELPNDSGAPSVES